MMVLAGGAIEAWALETLGIAGATVLVLGLAILTSLVARQGEALLRASTDQLRDRERQLAEAQEIAHVGSWQLDIAPYRVTWADAAYRMYGVPLGSPVGYDVFVERLHPEDPAVAQVKAAVRVLRARA